MPSSQPSRPTTTPAQITIIRIALFMGVITFGFVAWYVGSQEPAPSSGSDFAVLNYVFITLVAIAVSIAALMKRQQAATEDWGKRVSCGIIGWAACESTALFGGVYWLLTGEPMLYVIGVVLLVASLMLLAPRRPEAVA